MAMNIRVVGCGFYGAHLAASLIEDGHKVTVHEIKDRIFGGASGNIPARIHQGFHYPRSKKTRLACQEHIPEFLDHYGQFVRSIPTNIYAIASDQSMVDYAQYVDSLIDEVEFQEVDPELYGLRNVEGALLTKEQHIVVDDVREYFEDLLDGHIEYNTAPVDLDSKQYDLTIDATFCANESAGVDRYEPCVIGILSGPVDRAVTIMDGPFGSVYPWNETDFLSSLSSAKYTPFSKECKTYQEAQAILTSTPESKGLERVREMYNDMAFYYPGIKNYRIKEVRSSIRAMPLSGADSRLVDVVPIGDRSVRIRAGKIDAVVQAEKIIREQYIK